MPPDTEAANEMTRTPNRSKCLRTPRVAPLSANAKVPIRSSARTRGCMQRAYSPAGGIDSPRGHATDHGMHGEYKVPGGKLVVVDLEVVEGRITKPQVSGDFFLEPDTALEVMDRALHG